MKTDGQQHPDTWRSNLDTAIAELDDMASSDCIGELYNGDECPGCDDVENAGRVERCNYCTATRAMKAVIRALTPPLVPISGNRITNPPERIYVDLWREQNRRQVGVNHGYTLLELLLCPDEEVDPLYGHPRPKSWLTHREAQVATTIIMWLGTNCGQCFIHEAERRIKAERCEDAALDGYRINRPGAWDESDPDRALAQRIANRFISTDKSSNSLLAGTVAAALSMVRQGKTVDDLIEGDSV